MKLHKNQFRRSEAVGVRYTNRQTDTHTQQGDVTSLPLLAYLPYFEKKTKQKYAYAFTMLPVSVYSPHSLLNA
jgi:hypothetical protein